MNIRELEFFAVTSRPVISATRCQSIVLRLITDAGLEGWGEAALPWRPSELAARRESLLPVLSGRSIFDIEEIASLGQLQPAALRAGVEMACWDIAGQVAHLPIFRFFGGRFRDRIPISVRIPSGPTAQVAEAARELIDRGLHCLCLVASGTLDDDLQLVDTVLQTTGHRAEVYLDCRQGYSAEQACELCQNLEEKDIAAVIDPVASDDIGLLTALARQTSTPLAARRLLVSPDRMLALARQKPISLAIADIQVTGSLLRARDCGIIAQAGGLPAAITGGAPAGIATAAAVHLAAACPPFVGRMEIDASELLDNLLASGWEIVDGMLTVPQEPGLGIKIDPARLDEMQLT